MTPRPSQPRLATCRPLAAVLLLALALCGCGRSEPPPPAPAPQSPEGSSVSHYDSRGTAAPGRDPAVVPVVAPAPKPTGALPAGASCVTAECHAGYTASAQVHAPVAAGNCSLCHDGDAGGHQFPLKREGNATCTFCHTVTGTLPYEHAAVDRAGCVSCHDPHASPTPHLVKAASIERLCSHCHRVEWKQNAHAPFAAGMCTACHQPHQAEAANLLRGGAGAEHCYTCHGEMRTLIANAVSVHEPAAENCALCHDPHTSDHRHQLKSDVKNVCLGCHESMAKQIAEATTAHDAVFKEQSCGNCHDAHAANSEKLLRDRTDRLCMQCHDRPVTAHDGRTVADMRPTLQRKFLHGPVRSGNCTACHNVHGATMARLLNDAFPKTFYARFDLAAYTLCFDCHNKDLVLTEQTDRLTGFRDGSNNLHYVHVHRDDKGRTCKTCHDIHGSDLPRHMATEVPFEGSNWALPIRFSKSEEGGSCAPGCHAPKSYSRGSPAAATAPAGQPQPPSPTRGAS